MKPILIIIFVIVAAAAALFGYQSYQRSRLQASTGRGAENGQSDRAGNKEGEIPRGEDLCRATGGTGQIVSVGNNTFTLQRHDGKSEIINLTDRATIKTSVGSASVSDLKPGDRVTLIGDANPDGSFTADTVLVCAAAADRNAQTN